MTSRLISITCWISSSSFWWSCGCRHTNKPKYLLWTDILYVGLTNNENLGSDEIHVFTVEKWHNKIQYTNTIATIFAVISEKHQHTFFIWTGNIDELLLHLKHCIYLSVYSSSANKPWFTRRLFKAQISASDISAKEGELNWISFVLFTTLKYYIS